MQTREKLLAGAFAAVIGVGWVLPGIWATVRAPVTDRETTLRSLKRQLESKEDAEMKTEVAIRKVAEWKRRSLPEDALTAQRIYQVWLTRLAHECGWDDLDVVPGGTRGVGPGTSVNVSVEGRATVAEFAEFLKQFENAGLLHSIDRSSIASSSTNPDTPLEVSVSATALSLPEGGQTPLPYGEFELTEAASDVTSVAVTPVLSKVPVPFDVSVTHEGSTYLATVKKVDDKQRLVMNWDDAAPKSLPVDAKLIVQPLVVAEADNFWTQLADAGPFAIPRPKAADGGPAMPTSVPNSPPLIAAIDGKSLLPGEEWSGVVSATDPDGDDAAIRFSLDSPPPGAFLADGNVRFIPAMDSTPGDVTVTVVATDASGARSTQSISFRILTDPEKTIRLSGSVRIDGKPAALFIDDATEERIVRRPGDEFVAGRFRAKIDDIRRTSVIFVSAESRSELSLGERIAARQEMPRQDSDAAETAEQPVSE